jgi:predicted AAA+ superfamily ATPase
MNLSLKEGKIRMDFISTLQKLLGEFYDKLERFQSLVIREAYFKEAPLKIQVAIGMRRTGKTTFLYQKILELIKNGID